MSDTRHKFEIAGLGKGPFRLVGQTELIHKNGDGTTKAGGSCDYCSTAIRDAYIIQSADGKRFKVGSDCVQKTGDLGLVDLVKRAANRLKADRQRERDLARIELRMSEIEEFLKSCANKPHPHAYYAKEGRTLEDYNRYVWAASGIRSRISLINKWLGR